MKWNSPFAQSPVLMQHGAQSYGTFSNFPKRIIGVMGFLDPHYSPHEQCDRARFLVPNQPYVTSPLFLQKNRLKADCGERILPPKGSDIRTLPSSIQLQVKQHRGGNFPNIGGHRRRGTAVERGNRKLRKSKMWVMENGFFPLYSGQDWCVTRG